MIKFTPENITELKPNEVFVFGSNMAGNHAGGAARTAVEKFGAIMGQAEGLQGQSYAVPTLDENMNKVTPEQLQASLEKFAKYAANNGDKKILSHEDRLRHRRVLGGGSHQAAEQC